MLELRQVSKRFGKAAVLQNCTFAVGARESVGLFGPSGSGKTTILRLIAGLEQPDEGAVVLDGVVASDPRGVHVPPHERGIGFVFQSAALWPHMTVAQNIRFGLAGLARAERENRLRDALCGAGLEALAGRYPGELSGGEARRVALARALAPKPRLLLLDEPLTNLDHQAKMELGSLIRNTAASGNCAVLYVSHDMDELEAAMSRLVRVAAGRVCAT